jgi:general secretion pathway protein J
MSRARGFTLLEVLVATALLAVGMALAFTTLRTATGSVARAEQLAAKTEQTRSAQRFVRRQVSSALPLVFERDQRTGQPQVLLGEPERMLFVASMPGHLSYGGPHLQVLEIVADSDRDRDGYRLQFAYRMRVGEAVVEAGDQRPPVVLVDGIVDGGFQYRGMEDDGEVGDWRADWPFSNRMPMLVRLDIEFLDERRFWPPLAMALPLSGAASFQDELSTRTPRQRRGQR